MSYVLDTRPTQGSEFLLKEDSFFLLLEDGGKIILDQSMIYINDTKPTSQS